MTSQPSARWWQRSPNYTLPRFGNSDSFPKSVETLYNNIPLTDHVLRNPALDAVIEHAQRSHQPSWRGLEPTALTKVMDRVPEIGEDVAILLLSEVERL